MEYQTKNKELIMNNVHYFINGFIHANLIHEIYFNKMYCAFSIKNEVNIKMLTHGIFNKTRSNKYRYE